MAGLVDAIGGLLARDPSGKLGEAAVEFLPLRVEPENLGRARDVGEAVANVAGARLADNVGCQLLTAHRRGEAGRHIGDADAVAAANVEDAAISIGRCECQVKGARDIVDMHEIAALLAVFEHHGALAIQQPRGEDGKQPVYGFDKAWPAP